jgi:hypothetical protein
MAEAILVANDEIGVRESLTDVRRHLPAVFADRRRIALAPSPGQTLCRISHRSRHGKLRSFANIALPGCQD